MKFSFQRMLKPDRAGAREGEDEDDAKGARRPRLALRNALLIFVVVLNLLYFVWARGGFAVFGSVPDQWSESDPQRLEQQLRPQVVKIQKDRVGTARP